ncbi:MAG TPA: HNH endonuclease signature motif containing protein [Rhizomicrobium sp.]|jgi:5-methylcytosine-specific restriction protein A|nr:HNH endonuclease signature motif containing protein [Rhizomicrobium sp.]
MPDRTALRPTIKRLVIDLVEEAGIDVSEWIKVSGSRSKASVNPKYCYAWSFVQPGEVVVLNLWYANVLERAGNIYYELNGRRDASIARTARGRAIWKYRANRLDEAIRVARAESLPIRVVVCDGSMRDSNDPSANASRVKKRDLDSEIWAVASYNDANGDCVLVRGSGPPRTVDQFETNLEHGGPTEQRVVSGKIFIRDKAVRDRVLTRCRGKCELCGRPGFIRLDGTIYLETHHVIPLSQDGPDTDANVVAICANHHREAHHGQRAAEIRTKLQAFLSKL